MIPKVKVICDCSTTMDQIQEAVRNVLLETKGELEVKLTKTNF